MGNLVGALIQFTVAEPLILKNYGDCLWSSLHLVLEELVCAECRNSVRVSFHSYKIRWRSASFSEFSSRRFAIEPFAVGSTMDWSGSKFGVLTGRVSSIASPIYIYVAPRSFSFGAISAEFLLQLIASSQSSLS